MLNQSCLNKLIYLKKDKIEIGKAAYEFAVRNYIKDLPSKKFTSFYYALSKSLQILDQSKIFNFDKIALLVMAEIHFDKSIFFQRL